MAIILKVGRPAILIGNGTFERPEGAWSHLWNAPIRMRLETAIAAVGRINLFGSPTTSWLGTAFVVAPRLLLVFGLDLFVHKEFERRVLNEGLWAEVDFGHELEQKQSYRAEIKEIVHFLPNWNIGIVRAKIPETIQPLTLATFSDEEYADRQAALIGYPAFDARNDPTFTETLFGGLFDIKRLMPGRVSGVVPYTTTGSTFAPGAFAPEYVLEHDCTSLGGCGGAPLIDLETGHVLGIHVLGQYLLKNYAIPSVDLLADPNFEKAGVRFAEKRPSAQQLTRKAVQREAVKGEGISAEQMSALEKMVQQLIVQRPALLAKDWLNEAEASDVWRRSKLGQKPYKDYLNAALLGVGHLLIRSYKDEWVGAGTAFLVGEKLALTTSFVVQSITDGAGDQTRLKPGAQAVVDFGDALGAPAGEKQAAVRDVKFVHPFLHLALLEVDRTPEGTSALKLASQMPAQLAGREVAILAFVDGQKTDDPELSTRAYRGRWGHLFLHPGNAGQIGYLPGSLSVPVIFNNCSTMIDTSGGPLLDVSTGYVIGVHTKSDYLQGNYAQPTWELSRDPHVWDFAIKFWPDPRPSWLKDWGAPKLPASLAPVEAQPRQDQDRWTVDKVPIDWSLKAPRDMEQLLISSIKPEDIFITAGNIGFQCNPYTSQSYKAYWRDFLTSVSLAGLLRRFIDEICSDRSYAALEPKLRLYL